MAKYETWVAEATQDALRKENSALPLNRRVRTGVLPEGQKVSVTRYVRGAMVELGRIEVEL